MLLGQSLAALYDWEAAQAALETALEQCGPETLVTADI